MADEQKIEMRVPQASRFGSITKTEVESLLIREDGIYAMDAATGSPIRLWRLAKIPKAVRDAIKLCAERMRDKLEGVVTPDDA